MQKKLCTRKIDELGRIALPQEARRILRIKKKQNLDNFIDVNSILLKLNKDISVCSLCGDSKAQLTVVGHSLICDECITKIKTINLTK
jgi:transcriptional pleiotropic regulator of transition state genes